MKIKTEASNIKKKKMKTLIKIKQPVLMRSEDVQLKTQGRRRIEAKHLK